MRGCFVALRAACLFVGSVVGAGFATGREVALFFGGGSVWNIVLASAFIAFLSLVYMDLGARRALEGTRLAVGVRRTVAIASFVVYAAMLAAAETVLWETFGVRGLSLFMGIGSAFRARGGLRWTSRLNLVAVPVMIAIIVYVGWGGGSSGGEVRIGSSLAYGAMNLLFSGALAYKEGARMTKGERRLAALLIGGAVFVLLLFMYYSAKGESAMPFLLAAKERGVGALAPITLLLAIVTTMTGCNHIVTAELSSLVRDGTLAAAMTLLAGMLLAAWGFAPIVNSLYPAVSYLGLVVTTCGTAWWGGGKSRALFGEIFAARK